MIVDTETKQDKCDPEKLICEYIEAGGDWHQLATAVNRLALRGATKQ